jgi:hypothetical protein
MSFAYQDLAGASRQMTKCEECRKENVKQKVRKEPRTPNSWKCHILNTVKIQCTPVGRSWPEQKCDRCLAKGLPCGPNIRSRKRSRGDAAGVGASDVSGPTAPAPPSHHRSQAVIKLALCQLLCMVKRLPFLRLCSTLHTSDLELRTTRVLQLLNAWV